MFAANQRVKVINQHLPWYNQRGTVRTVDSSGKIWVRLDGFPAHKRLPFFPDDLTNQSIAPSPLVYGDEPTTHAHK